MYYTSTSRYGLANTTIHKVCVTLRTNVSFPIDGLIPFNHSYPVRVRSSQMHRSRTYIYREGPRPTITILPMPSPNPLQRLQGLDRSSPEFPNRLTDILGEDWMNHAQNLSPNDLEEFVEYLDSVCVWVAFTHPLLNNIVDPQRPQPHQPRLLSLFV